MGVDRKKITILFFFSIFIHICAIAYLGEVIGRNMAQWRRIKVDMRILEPQPQRYIPMHRSVPRDPPPDKLPLPQKPPPPDLRPKNPQAIKPPQPIDAPALDFTDSPYGDRIGFAARDFNFSSDNRDALLSAYRLMVNKSIEARKKYPPIARKMGYEGVVRLQFVVSAPGELLDVKIIRNSGFDILDQAALETIKAAAPFPAVPVKVRGDRLTIQTDLVFLLK